MLGTKELNKALQKELNGEKHKKEKTYGERIFRIDDRVMQIKNNYDIYWMKDEETGTGVFNGEIGKIKDIDDDAKQIEIIFDDGKTVLYDVNSDINDIPSYQDLKNIKGLFNSVQVDASRTCVFWTDDIDLPSDIIYEYGESLD